MLLALLLLDKGRSFDVLLLAVQNEADLGGSEKAASNLDTTFSEGTLLETTLSEGTLLELEFCLELEICFGPDSNLVLEGLAVVFSGFAETAGFFFGP